MNTRATSENTAKLVAMQSDNAGMIANSQNNYSGATMVLGKHSASRRTESDAGETPEASTKSYYDMYWELEKSLQFTSDKGCRDYLANKIEGMNDEAKKIIDSKLRHYMQFDNPVGIRTVVREILSER
ncbi:MAG: hypothetical protein IJC56_08660 [Clostridia bacterium]|nr:hypothetical protein [Clostridia bacterium]